jgi:hypothetical protein
VKPRRNFLEFWIFLGRVVKGPQIKKVVESSRVKRAHLLKITHRDEIDSPITDWMKEAYELQDNPPPKPKAKAKKKRRKA